MLALPFAREHRLGDTPVSLRAYFLRRVTRLEAPYRISLVLLLALRAVGHGFGVTAAANSPVVLLRHFAASAVYLHNLIYGDGSLINGVAWSLEVEVQFYLLVPALTAVFRISSAASRRPVIVAAAVASIAFQHAFVPPGTNRLSLSILGYLQYFLLGFLLADLYLMKADFASGQRRWIWDVASVVAWPLIFLSWRSEWAALLVPGFSLVAFVAVFRGPVSNRVFTNPWITTFGGMCYSIYLLHFTIISVLGHLFARVWAPSGTLWMNMLMRGPLLLTVAVTVCVGYFYAVERPCMDRSWPVRFASTVRARAAGLGRLTPRLDTE